MFVNLAVTGLTRPVRFRMVWRGMYLLDVSSVTYRLEYLANKFRAVITDNLLWYSHSVYDLLESLSYFFSRLSLEGF